MQLLLHVFAEAAQNAKAAGQIVGLAKKIRDLNASRYYMFNDLHQNTWGLLADEPELMGKSPSQFVWGGASRGDQGCEQQPSAAVKASAYRTRELQASSCEDVFGPGWTLPTISELKIAHDELKNRIVTGALQDLWFLTESVETYWDYTAAEKNDSCTAMAYRFNRHLPAQTIKVIKLSAMEHNIEQRRLGWLEFHSYAKPLGVLCIKRQE